MKIEHGVSFPLWSGSAPLSHGSADTDIPTLTPYIPSAWKANRKVVIIFPGGAYSHLADHEGRGYAEYLAGRGYLCFVLKYRLGSSGYRHPAELSDAARAVRLIRSEAKSLGICGDRIGVMGSSAGGHLAASLGNLFSEALYEDGEDKTVSSRPDWTILCYPVITLEPPFSNGGSARMLMGENPSAELVKHLSCEQSVTKDTPPSFVWHTFEDPGVPVENSLMYAAALRRNGIPFELHIYEKGSHGRGLFDGHPWAEECVRWMDHI